MSSDESFIHKAMDSLEKAILLMDPPPSSTLSSHELTVQDIAGAHDLLLEAATLLEKHNKNGIHLNVCKRISLLADIYKALLVSCHLLLEMVTFHEDDEDDEDTDEDDKIESTTKSSSKSTFQYLTLKDEHKIYETMNQCIYLLRSLSLLYQLQTHTPIKEHIDDMNVVLPPSSYPFLQLCFEGSDQLISLHPNDQDVIHQDYDILSPPPPDFQKDTKDNHNIYKYDKANSEDDCEDIEEDNGISLDLDSNQLQIEESLLLDIAFPSSLDEAILPVQNDHVTADSKHVNHTTKDTSLSLSQQTFHHEFSYVLQEGWLLYYHNIDNNNNGIKIVNQIQVDSKDTIAATTEYTSTTTTTTMTPEKTRVYCKVDIFGFITLYTYPPENDKYESSQSQSSLFPPNSVFMMLALTPKSICEPVIHGKTFHFSIHHVDHLIQSFNLSLLPSSSSISTSQNNTVRDNSNHDLNVIHNVLFEIDVQSGGGLSTGFQWVTVIQSLIANRMKQIQNQSNVQNAWSLQEWNTKVQLQSEGFWNEYKNDSCHEKDSDGDDGNDDDNEDCKRHHIDDDFQRKENVATREHGTGHSAQVSKVEENMNTHIDHLLQTLNI